MTMPAGVPDFELRSAAPATLDELDAPALAGFVRRRAPRLSDAPLEDALVRLGLAVRGANQTHPTNLALYVFGREPQLLRPAWGLVAACFDGPTLAAPVRDRVDAEGPLPELLAAALAFVAAHTLAGATAAEASRTAPPGDPTEYPQEAVREAVVNALVHRDLRAPARVALRLFPDRLEVWSPGGGPSAQGLALPDLLEEGGVSLPRNPLLAATARTLGLGEQLGRGLPLIRAAVADLGREPVEIRATPTDVLVVLPNASPRTTLA